MRILLVLLCLLLGVQDYRIGALSDTTAHPHGGLALMGGGTDQDAAFRWLIDRADHGDILVLRASGGDDYNPYIQEMGPVHSVETLVFHDRAAASDAAVVDKVRHASGIFFAGGDQWNYVHDWQGTPLAQAVDEAAARGVPIGGTSAGLAILGEYVFSAQFDTIDSPDALRDPFDTRITLIHNFLHLPLLEGTITDTHFVRRHREGRLLAFMAHLPHVRGIGVDERTALLVEPNGIGHPVGQGSVLFYQADHPPERCVPGQPLSTGPVDVYRLQAGRGGFDIPHWRGEGGVSYTVQYTGGDPR